MLEESRCEAPGAIGTPTEEPAIRSSRFDAVLALLYGTK